MPVGPVVSRHRSNESTPSWFAGSRHRDTLPQATEALHRRDVLESSEFPRVIRTDVTPDSNDFRRIRFYHARTTAASRGSIGRVSLLCAKRQRPDPRLDLGS